MQSDRTGNDICPKCLAAHPATMDCTLNPFGKAQAIQSDTPSPEALAAALNRDLFSPTDCVAKRRASPRSVEHAKAMAVLEAATLIRTLEDNGWAIAARQGSPDGLADDPTARADRIARRMNAKFTPPDPGLKEPVREFDTASTGFALLNKMFGQPAEDVETVQHITQAMAVALRRDCTNPRGECYAVTSGPCPQEGGWPTEVDGEFDLENLAKAALAAMPAPAITEAMVATGALAIHEAADNAFSPFEHMAEMRVNQSRACLTAALGQRP